MITAFGFGCSGGQVQQTLGCVIWTKRTEFEAEEEDGGSKENLVEGSNLKSNDCIRDDTNNEFEIKVSILKWFTFTVCFPTHFNSGFIRVKQINTVS